MIQFPFFWCTVSRK